MDTKKKLRKRKRTRTRTRIKPRIKPIIKPRIKTRKKLINFFYKNSKKNKKAKGGPTSSQRNNRSYKKSLNDKQKRAIKNAIKYYKNKKRKNKREKKLREEKEKFIETLKKELKDTKTLSNNEIKIGERLADKFNLPIDTIVKILEDVDITTIEKKQIKKIAVLEEIINDINNTSIGTEFVDELLSNSHEDEDTEKISNLLEKIKKYL